MGIYESYYFSANYYLKCIEILTTTIDYYSCLTLTNS